MSESKRNKRNLTCYACRESFDYDFYECQQERTRFMYSMIKENKEQPRNYYVRCPHCHRYNRTRH